MSCKRLTTAAIELLHEGSNPGIANGLEVPNGVSIQALGNQQTHSMGVQKVVRPFATGEPAFSFEKIAANVKPGTIILLNAGPIPFVIGTAHLERQKQKDTNIWDCTGSRKTSQALTFWAPVLRC